MITKQDNTTQHNNYLNRSKPDPCHVKKLNFFLLITTRFELASLTEKREQPTCIYVCISVCVYVGICVYTYTRK
jgi:hypothetical protein